MIKAAVYLSQFCILVFSPLSLFAQKIDLADYQNKYPENAAIYLEYNKEITIDKVADTIQVFESHLEKILHLNSNSKYLAKDKVFSSFFIKTKSISAETLIPKGDSYSSMKVEDLVEKDESSEGVFYDDSKSTNFIYPGIQPGAITVLKYTQQILDPRFLSSFFFQSFLPVESAKLTLKVDKSITINSLIFNQGDLQIDTEESKKGKYNIYTWTAHNIPKVEYEENAPNYSYIAPHIIYYIEKIKTSKGDKVVLENVKDLFHWYATFTSHLKNTNDPALKKKVDELVSGLKTTEDKVKAIFYWVQDNIKYIAFEEGMRGFIPHNPGVIFTNRYGDCKDMASITRGMLQLAGIDAYLTWIGSRDIPYNYNEVPTPIVDNHMITTWFDNGKPVFLDATSKYTPFGLPSSMIQGKQALIQTGDNTFELKTVPIVDKEVNYTIDSSSISLESGKLLGKGKVSMGGYDKIFNTYRISYSSGNKLDDLMKSKLTRGSNKFLVTDYKIENLDNKDKPLIINYSYSIDDYYKHIGDEIYINLNLDRTFFNQLIDIKTRKYPIEKEYKYVHTYIYDLAIPAGFEVEYLPENSSYSNNVGGFTIKYVTKKGFIHLEKQIFVDYLMLEQKDFGKWNDVVKAISNAYTDAIILKKSDKK